MDVLQMQDVYNNRQSGLTNWRLRIPDHFKDLYYAKLEKNEGVNMPEILKRAIDIKVNKKEISAEQAKPVLKSLDKYEKILKEKTPDDKINSKVKEFLKYEDELKKKQKINSPDEKESVVLSKNFENNDTTISNEEIPITKENKLETKKDSAPPAPESKQTKNSKFTQKVNFNDFEDML
jgi:hypothetical protein